jgi:alanine dehydrogenase
MHISVPREIKKQEHRVALLPATAHQLVHRGHKVTVERGAGAGCGYPDVEYLAAGAELVDSHADAFDADLIVKVKEPQPEEIPLLGPGKILFTYLHLAANKVLTDSLVASGVTAVAYETIEINRRLPAARADERDRGTHERAIVGASCLAKQNRRHRRAARRCARRAAGQGRRPRRRHRRASTPRAWPKALAPM